MDVFLFDRNKEVIDIIPPSNLTASEQTNELNGLIKHMVSGVYEPSVEQAQFFGMKDVDDANVFHRYKITNLKKESGKFTLDGIYELFDDLKSRTIIEDRRPQNENATSALQTVLEDTGWQVGNVSTYNTGTTNWYYVTPLEAFWDYIETWHVEFSPRMIFNGNQVIAKYIDISNELSDDYGELYEYGSDLLTVTAEQNNTDIYTAFIGRGKGEQVSESEENPSGQAGYGRKITFEDAQWSTANGDPVDKPLGQKYVEIPEATSRYGYEDGTPRFTTVDFSDIEDVYELLQATYDYALVESRPKLQFKSDVHETGQAELGETVTIIRDDLNIRYKTRIFKLQRNFLNKEVKKLEFGDSLTQSRAQQNVNTTKRINNLLEEQNTFWLDTLRNAITDTYWNEDGYNYDLQAGNEYSLPGGYYSFDRPIDQDPSKAIYMGAGSLLIANSKNPDGHWEWRTAATGDGIVADEINTGTLNAAKANIINLNVDSLVGNRLNFITGAFSGLNTDMYLNAHGITIDASEYTDMRLDRAGVTFDENGANTPIGGVSVLKEPGDQASIQGLWLFTNRGYNTSISYEVDRTDTETVYRSALMVDGTTGQTNMYGRFHLEDQMDIHGDIRFMQDGYNRGTIQQDGATDDINLRYSSRFKVIRGKDDLIKLSVDWNNTYSYNNWIFNKWDLTDIGQIRGVNDVLTDKLSISTGNEDSIAQTENGRLNFNFRHNIDFVRSNQGLVKWTMGSWSHASYAHINLNNYNLLNVGQMKDTSDRRLKTNIEDYSESMLETFFEAINPVTFNWKDADKTQEQQIGLIAQDTPIISDYIEETDTWSIDSKKQIMLNTFGVKELLNRDSDKENRLRKLEAENKGLKDRIDQLEGAN